MTRKFILIVFTLVLLATTQVTCRFLSNRIHVRKLTRPPFSTFIFKTPASGQSRGTFKYTASMVSDTSQPLSLTLGIYTSDTFNNYNDDTLVCNDKLAITSHSHALAIDLRSSTHYDLTIDFSDYGIRGDSTATIYFVVFDCGEMVKRHTSADWKLVFTFDVRHGGGSYLHGMDVWVCRFKIAGLLFLVVFFVVYMRQIKREFMNEYSDTNYAFMIVAFASAIRVIAIVIDIIEIYCLKLSGDESPIIHFFAKTFEIFSAYLIQLTMLFLAHGWTITFSKIEDMELFLPLSIALGVLKLILVGMGRLVKLDQHHFHAFDGFVGMIMCFFNVTMLLYYFYQVYQLRDSIKNHKKVNKFYTVLSLVVIWYLGTFPVGYVTAYLMDDWKRAAVIELVNTVGQLVGSLALAWLLTAKGRYTDIADFDLGLPSSLKRQD